MADMSGFDGFDARFEAATDMMLHERYAESLHMLDQILVSLTDISVDDAEVLSVSDQAILTAVMDRLVTAKKQVIRLAGGLDHG